MPQIHSRFSTIAAALLFTLCLHSHAVLAYTAPAVAPALTPVATLPSDLPDDWVLTFDDEFGQKAVDPSKWLVTDGTYEQREDVRQYYTPLEVTEHDGSLYIGAEQKPMGGRDFMSGDLRTIDRFGQLYGKFEMRAREPRGIGAWPAFWLLPAAGTWPPEIDIAESMGAAPNQLCDSNHWGSTMATHGNHWLPFTSPTFDITDWHTYSVIWGPGTLTWYVDDQSPISKPADEPVSAVPMFMRLNTAVGPIAGDPAKGTWPQTFQVDWVRAYRRKDAPPPVCAGPNRVVTYPATTTDLAGYSCNPIGSVKLLWTKTSGPGRVTFGNRQSAATSATFDKPGEYHLRLTAVDGALSSFDETTIFVDGSRDLARPAMQNAMPVAVSTPSPTVAAPPVDPPGPAELTALELTLPAKPKSPAAQRFESKLYFKFDLTDAGRVKSARLRFMAGIAPDGTAGSATFGVYAVTDDAWRETRLTIDNAPPLGPLIGTTTIAPDSWRGLDVWHEVDVSDVVKSAIHDHDDFMTLCVAPVDATQDYDVTFKSRMAAGSEPSLILSGSSAASSSVLGSKNWVPTFDDEFDGSAVDPKKWRISVRNDVGSATPPVAFDSGAITVRDGALNLESARRADGTYSSGELISQGRFAQRYGRFEVRAKIGGTTGSWSMADLLPDLGTWPPGIDLYSHIGRMPDTIGFTNHWGQSATDDHFDYWLLRRPGFDPSDWHVYALEWTATALRWYVDGVLTHTKAMEPIPDEPMYIKVASMVGGNYPGDASKGVWPQTYSIDYVRVFRPADQAEPGP